MGSVEGCRRGVGVEVESFALQAGPGDEVVEAEVLFDEGGVFASWGGGVGCVVWVEHGGDGDGAGGGADKRWVRC